MTATAIVAVSALVTAFVTVPTALMAAAFVPAVTTTLVTTVAATIVATTLVTAVTATLVTTVAATIVATTLVTAVAATIVAPQVSALHAREERTIERLRRKPWMIFGKSHARCGTSDEFLMPLFGAHRV